jgi:hypothetical protein
VEEGESIGSIGEIFGSELFVGEGKSCWEMRVGWDRKVGKGGRGGGG